MMSNEEFEKKVEFIVGQQAQFAAQIGQLEDLIARLAKATLDRFETSDRFLLSSTPKCAPTRM